MAPSGLARPSVSELSSQGSAPPRAPQLGDPIRCPLYSSAQEGGRGKSWVRSSQEAGLAADFLLRALLPAAGRGTPTRQQSGQRILRCSRPT